MTEVRVNKKMNDEIWGKIKNELANVVGSDHYRNWIEPLQFAGLKDSTAVFHVPTNFIGDWVTRNYSDLILGRLKAEGVPVTRVSFTLPQHRTRSSGAATAQNAVPRPAQARAAQASGNGGGGNGGGGDDDLPGAPLDPRFTFDRFVVGKPNELAHAAAKRVAENREVSFNPLFLYGGVGLGKTHLMHAIAHELTTRGDGLRVVYLSAEQFMYRFVQALRDKQMMDFKQLFRSVDVLMVDDVQFIAGKDSTQEEFFHTFNALVDQNKQIIISADRAPNEIKHLETRISSRLQCGLVVDLHPTDYELRLGILQQKVENQRQQYPDLVIADGVLEFLAHRISNNVRVLEGALMRLFAFATLVGREINLELTQECLADILRASDRKITIEEIQRRVSEHYNIRLSDLIGPRRLRAVARPRQVAMYLSKQLTSRSLPEIGRRFGNRDHTTILHGVKKIEELMAQDSQLADDIEMLRRSLEA